MWDLNTLLLLYTLRVALDSLEQNPVSDQHYLDESQLQSVLKQEIVKLQARILSSSDGWVRPDAASFAQKTGIHRPTIPTSAEQIKMPYASTLISVLRATLRTIERSPEIPPESPALHELRHAVAAMIAELEPAAKKEPKFELRTGADLYSSDSSKRI